MSITKIVAILIPIITLGLWTYFFISEKNVVIGTLVAGSITRLCLVIFLIPLIFISFSIAYRVWRIGRPKSTIVRS